MTQKEKEGYWLVCLDGQTYFAHHDGDSPDDYPFAVLEAGGGDTYDEEDVIPIKYLGTDVAKILIQAPNSVEGKLNES